MDSTRHCNFTHDLIRNGILLQTCFLQRINLVTLTLSEAVIGSHSCSFTFDGEKHLGIAASRIIPWVKLHWRVESALLNSNAIGIKDMKQGRQRWSQKFGPLVKMDQLMGKMIQNDKEKEPFA